MKKTLFIAALSALTSPALFAAVTSSQTDSYTAGSASVTASENAPIYVVKTDSNGEQANLPSAPVDLATATVLQGGRFKVSNTDNTDTANHGTIIIASGTDAEGDAISGGQLFVDGWGVTTNIANDLIIGQSSYQEGAYSSAAIRIHEGATISGSVKLADDAKIITSGSGGTNVISGSVTGENYTLTLSGDRLLNVTGEVTVGGINTSATGAVNFQNNVSVSSSVINGGGALTFSQLTFDTSDLSRYQIKECLEETDVPGEDQNGFGTGRNVYYLIKNTGANANTSATTVSLADGTSIAADGNNEYTLEATGRTDRYYVNTGSVNASDALGAASVALKDGATFTLDSTDAAAPTLGSITGSGTVVVAVETVLGDGSTDEHLGLNKSQATGKLVINSGARLILGNAAEGGAHSEEIGDISSFSSVDLNGTLRINGHGSNINNVTVGEGGGTLRVWDTYSDFSSNEITLKGDTTLNGTLLVTNRWKNNTRIEHLLGSGNLSVESGSSNGDNDRTVFTIDSVKDYTGVMTFTKNQGALTANVQIGDGETLKASQLNIGSGAVVNLRGSGTYALSEGSSSLNGVTLSRAAGAQWMGAVRVSGQQSDSVDLSTLGTNASSIVLNNVSGSLASATVSAVVKLESDSFDALTVTGGATNVTFYNSVTGGKNIVDQTAGSFTFGGERNDFTFIGDTQPSTITFEANATRIDASVKKHGRVIVNNNRAVTLNGDFTHAGWTGNDRDVHLEINNTGVTTFTGGIDVGSMNVLNGSQVYTHGYTAIQSLILSENSVVSILKNGSSLSLSSLTVLGDMAHLDVSSLILGDGADLTLNSCLYMNKDLTMGSGLTLSGALYDLLTSSETSVTLFQGASSWTPTGAVVGRSEGEVTYSASDVFDTSDWNSAYIYTLSYDGCDVTLSSKLIPEPTTATLSLLALAGLLARRRRRQ